MVVRIYLDEHDEKEALIANQLREIGYNRQALTKMLYDDLFQKYDYRMKKYDVMSWMDWHNIPGVYSHPTIPDSQPSFSPSSKRKAEKTQKTQKQVKHAPKSKKKDNPVREQREISSPSYTPMQPEVKTKESSVGTIDEVYETGPYKGLKKYHEDGTLKTKMELEKEDIENGKRLLRESGALAKLIEFEGPEEDDVPEDTSPVGYVPEK